MKTNTFTEKINGKGMKIAIVASRFNQGITDALVLGAQNALRVSGVGLKDQIVVRVPGSFELPQTANFFAKTKKFDAIVCLGVLIKGETDHDVYIAQAVSEGLMRVSIDNHLPVMFGVLTCNNKAQADARAEGIAEKNKGYEAAMSALEMVVVERSIKKSLRRK